MDVSLQCVILSYPQQIWRHVLHVGGVPEVGDPLVWVYDDCKGKNTSLPSPSATHEYTLD